MPNEPTDGLGHVRTWQEIAEETSHEHNSAKLKQLSEELAHALDERDKRLHPPHPALALNGKTRLSGPCPVPVVLPSPLPKSPLI
jgi:hypothetical protein